MATVRFTVELDVHQLSKLQLLADHNHRSRKAEAEYLIARALDTYGKEELAK